MKDLWCWRCKVVVPVLNEAEFKVAQKLHSAGFKTIRDKDERFTELRKYYNELTGFEETNGNAIMHHRVSLYGPPCENCGKPYRTPKASFCAACGNKRDQLK